MTETQRLAGRFGKLAPRTDYRTLLFASYLTPELPSPPQTVDMLQAVYAKLGNEKPATLFPMDGNDSEGCCTIAGVAHGITIFRALLGARLVMSTELVHQIYRQLSGGRDTGLNMLDVLNYWFHNAPIPGEEILGFVSVDPKNHVHVMQAIQIFRGVFAGFRVQQGAQQQFANHQPWVPGPLTNDGHAVWIPFADKTAGVQALTWGGVQPGTWPWWDECVDECWAVIPAEAAVAGFATGLDLATFQADLVAIGNAPPVIPIAPPPPIPSPDSYDVGPGLRALLAARALTPASDEQFLQRRGATSGWLSLIAASDGKMYGYIKDLNTLVAL